MKNTLVFDGDGETDVCLAIFPQGWPQGKDGPNELTGEDDELMFFGVAPHRCDNINPEIREKLIAKVREMQDIVERIV